MESVQSNKFMSVAIISAVLLCVYNIYTSVMDLKNAEKGAPKAKHITLLVLAVITLIAVLGAAKVNWASSSSSAPSYFY